MRAGRMQYRGQVGSATGSVVEPAYLNDAALASSMSGGDTSGRPGLVLLGLVILGMGAFAWWTR